MNDLDNMEIFTKNLKYYMELNNKDRNTICKDLNIPYTTFAEWYNGNIYPRIDKIELLANYFNIKKSDLIEQKSKDANDIFLLKNLNIKGLEKEDVKKVQEYIDFLKSKK